MMEARAHCGPHAESAIDVNPRSIPACDGDERFEVVEVAGIHVPSLKQHNCGLVCVVTKCAFECRRVEPAGFIEGKHVQGVVTEAEQPERAVDGGVALPAEH